MSLILPRAIASRIQAATPPKAVVVLGARRVGKTTLLNGLPNLGRVESLSGDFRWDVEKLESLESLAAVQTFLADADTIIIDEAQRVPNIGLIIKRLVDANTGTRIFVTGSSALNLAAGVRESAVGRIVQAQLWPFSLEELARVHGWGYVERNLERFMIFGLFPEAVTDPENTRVRLMNYVQDIMLKDAFALGGIRNLAKIQELLEILARRIGSEVSYESLGRDLKINSITVERYIKVLEMCFVVRTCRSFSRNLANELKKGKKVYFCDLGVRNALINDFSPLLSRKTRDAGAIWENFFFIERLKQHKLRESFVEQYFWRLRGARRLASTEKPVEYSREIDFIEVQDNVMKAYECKLSPDKRDNGGEDFRQAYPECPIQVVTPADVRRTFSDYDWGEPCR